MSISSTALTLSKEDNQQADLAGLKNLEERMNRALIDQPEAINCVAEMIKRIKAGFYDESRPRGVLVFAGPTGVGKTELAKMTAYEMGIPLQRFDMSEFSESYKVSRLLGSPSGYVNSDRGGELVNKLKSTPTCVVLFDEIEKAHPDIYKVFLQLFDEGRLTDAIGQEVDATKAIFILTTNLGSHEIHQQMKTGVRDHLDERLKALCIRTFSAELYNRFDKVVVFRPLSQSAMQGIVEKYLRYLRDSLAQRKLEMTWDQQVVIHLSALSVDVNMGARDMHRKVREHVLSKLTASRIEGEILQTDVKVSLKVVHSQLEVFVLDKGRSRVTLEQEPTSLVSKGIAKKTEAVILKEGVVYLDHTNGRPLKDLEGKYVYRLIPKGQDHAYMESCIKIVELSSIGEILYESSNGFFRAEGRLRFLSSSWNDGEWVPATPAKNGEAFFENVCTVIEDPSSKKQALSLVKKIFTKIKEDCHLSERAPFASLRECCIRENKEDVLKHIEVLEKLLGPLSVKILSNKQDGTLRSKL